MIKSFAEAFNDDYQVITPNPDEKLPPVEVWLKGFRDADFVVTDSFHGVAFSIVNGVDFVVLANKDRGLTRVENLLSMVGISKDRLIFTDKTKAIKHNDLEPIRWEDVDKRLDRLRSDSGSWLLENVKRHKL